MVGLPVLLTDAMNEALHHEITEKNYVVTLIINKEIAKLD